MCSQSLARRPLQGDKDGRGATHGPEGSGMTRSSGAESDGARDVLPFGPLLLLLLPFVTFGRFALGDELANADVFLAYRPEIGRAHV